MPKSDFPSSLEEQMTPRSAQEGGAQEPPRRAPGQGGSQGRRKRPRDDGLERARARAKHRELKPSSEDQSPP